MEHLAQSSGASSWPAATTGSSSLEEEFERTSERWVRHFNFGEAGFGFAAFRIALSVFLSKGATRLGQLPWVNDERLRHLFHNPPSGEMADISSMRRMEARVSAEVALACVRFLNLSDWSPEPRSFCVENQAIMRRDKTHALYVPAARGWCRGLASAPEPIRQAMVDEGCRLFSSARSGSFQSWLLELTAGMFPEMTEAQRGLLFINLLQVLAKTASPLHIAACLGLDSICGALIEKGFDVNQKSQMGCPLYCAITGAALFGCFFGSWSYPGVPACLLSGTRKQTIQLLVDAGAVACQDCEVAKQTSPAWAALMRTACCKGPPLAFSVLALGAELRDLGFLASYLSFPDAFLDENFLVLFQDPFYPIYPDGTPADEKKELWFYMDDLCALLIDRSWRRRRRAVWDAAWSKARAHGLPCADPQAKRPLRLDQDELAEYYNEARHCRAEEQEEQVCNYLTRIIQDGRKSANWVTGLDNSFEAGQTLLHDAVEAQNLDILELLVDFGNVDISVRDGQGRTPLHFCTGDANCSQVLNLLVRSGADLSSTENDGRTLWHYAAANNDIELLHRLAEIDTDRSSSLKRTTKIERTPLAEAFAYVRELVGLSDWDNASSEVRKVHLRSIFFLLGLCKEDAAYLRSDVPILCYVAEWGCTHLLKRLLQFHRSLELTTPDGSNPLHFLNFGASRAIILGLRRIPGISQLPALNNAGHTPAETVFLAFKPNTETYDKTAHPSTMKRLDASAYDELLTEAVRVSVDQQGRNLWERFCSDVIAHYASRASFDDIIWELLTVAVASFIRYGVIQEQDSAFFAMTHALQKANPPTCPHWIKQVFDLLLQFLHSCSWEDVYIDYQLRFGRPEKKDSDLWSDPSVVWALVWSSWSL